MKNIENAMVSLSFIYMLIVELAETKLSFYVHQHLWTKRGLT